MKPIRMITGLAMIACLTLPCLALAQAKYPAKPIRVVVPGPAGLSPDIIARLWGERLSKAAGQPVLVDNKPGAATIIGTQHVAAAPADGYTLLYTVNNTFSINPYIFAKLPYKADDFVPVIRILTVPYIVVVPVESRFRTLRDLIIEAKSHPGKLSYGSYGVGQGTHVAMARLLNEAGATIEHIPYNAPPLKDLMGGMIDVLADASTTAVPLIKGGKIRALAVMGAKRLEALPDVPTVGETLPGFVAESWQGVFVPKGTPPQAVALLSTELNKIVAVEDFRARLRDYALIPAGGTPADFRKFLAADAGTWAKVVRENNIKLD
ncbi:MAG: Tripartite-type tricarboxylate transporter, receptor component TctC [Ramlibacter sp.]|nr:Tripartite-type tricarboxylate transporter, receptor component TctC [Ramlibacter sp.]